MANVFDPLPTPVYTRDGKDGFPSEYDFEILLAEYIAALNPRKREKALMTQAMYDAILTILTNPNNTRESTAQFRFWTKKMFRLVTTAHAQVVTHENRPVAVKEQIYDVLVQCHSQCSHGGRDKTSNQVRRYYSWIPKELIARFVKACPLCQIRRQTKTGGQFGYAEDASSPVSETGAHTPKSTQTTPSSAAVKSANPFAAGPHPMFAALFPPMPAPSQNPADWTAPPQNPAEFTPWVISTPQRVKQYQQYQAQPQQALYPHQQMPPPHMMTRPPSAAGSDPGQQAEVDVFTSSQGPEVPGNRSGNQSGILTPRTMDLVNQWCGGPQESHMRMNGPEDANRGQGHASAMPPPMLDPNLLPPPGMPSPTRRFSYDSNLTVDSTDSERPGSSHSSALSLPETPPSKTSRLPVALDINPQEVDDYFSQYGNEMDAVTQAASLEGLAGIALMKGVVEATSADLSRRTSTSSSDSNNRRTDEALVGGWSAEEGQNIGQSVQEGAQLQITVQAPQAEEQQEYEGQDLSQDYPQQSFVYSDQSTIDQSGIYYQPGQLDEENRSFEGQVDVQGQLYSSAGMISEADRQAYADSSFYTFAQYEDGNATGISMVNNASGDSSFESVEGAQEPYNQGGDDAGNTSAEFRVRVRPPPLDLGAFSNINMLQNNSFLGTAFNYSLSGSVSAPAHVTHFPDANSPLAGQFDQQHMLHGSSFDGTLSSTLTGGDDVNAHRPSSAMSFLHPHQQPLPSSWSSGSSATLSSCSSLSSSGSYFVPPLSIVPAIHSAPFFQMPLSTQQQQAASRELSESIQNLLESTMPNPNAKPEKMPWIDPSYRRMLAGLQKQ